MSERKGKVIPRKAQEPTVLDSETRMTASVLKQDPNT